MFIIGAVGVGMLQNASFGYIIFISHIIGALLNGFIYRKLKVKEIDKVNNISSSKKEDLSSIVLDSVLSILSVGTIIAIFFVVITSFAPLINLFPKNIACILEGIIEITKGCLDISLLTNNFLKIIACTFVISFGGISTLLQSITMLNKLKMPISVFAIQKFSHAILATIISALLCLAFAI